MEFSDIVFNPHFAGYLDKGSTDNDSMDRDEAEAIAHDDDGNIPPVFLICSKLP